MDKRELLTDGEVELLESIIFVAIKNGNSVDSKAFVPTRDEYIKLFEIRKKLLAD